MGSDSKSNKTVKIKEVQGLSGSRTKGADSDGTTGVQHDSRREPEERQSSATGSLQDGFRPEARDGKLRPLREIHGGKRKGRHKFK